MRKPGIGWRWSAVLLLMSAGSVIARPEGQPAPARTVEFADSTVKVSIWEEAAANGAQRTMYSVSLDGQSFTEPRESDHRILFTTGAFDPLDKKTVLPEVPDTLKSTSASDVRLVQFHTPAMEAYFNDIAQIGGEVWGYLPNNAFIVRIGEAGRQSLSSRGYVRWMGGLDIMNKLDPVCRQTVDAAGVPGAEPVAYNVMVYKRGRDQKDTVVARINAIGGSVVEASGVGRLMHVRLTPEQLLEVARLDQVMYIDPTGTISADGPEDGDGGGIGYDMNLVREATGAIVVRDTLGFTGQGVRAELADDNIRSTHADFQLHPPVYHGSRAGPTDHGTNMYGVIFGSGAADPLGTGMMPEAQGIFVDTANVELDRYNLTAQLLATPYFAVLQSNSWGGDQTPFYTSRSAQIDDILFDFNIVLTNSMSNLGNQNARPEAWAKNIISVGAILHRDTLTVADDCWCGLGSVGPASDGRIKPDVSNYGDFVYSPVFDCDTCYGQGCCTSVATAITSGTVGLFMQIWHSGLFGNTPGATVFDSRPKNTLVKAMMINSAKQWTFSGPGKDLGRSRQGWGQPSLANIINNSTPLLINETEVLAPLGSRTWNVLVNPGESFLKATMVYSDPAAVPFAAVHRINNLSLRLTSPGGTVYWGNNGLSLGNWSSAGGSEDNLNTVENVYIQNPASGNWQVTVIASEINEDSHVETPALDSDFSLVVTKPGVTEPAPGFEMTWFTVDGGGATFSTGDNFQMGSTTGQPDARKMISTGGEYALGGGFWSAEQGPGCVGDANADGVVNAADLSVLLSQFGSAVTPGSGADFNADGAVNAADLSVLLSNFGCPV